MKKSKSRKKLNPDKVITVWRCVWKRRNNCTDSCENDREKDSECDYDCDAGDVEVSVSFFEDNGTPVCECGCDMSLSGVYLLED